MKTKVEEEKVKVEEEQIKVEKERVKVEEMRSKMERMSKEQQKLVKCSPCMDQSTRWARSSHFKSKSFSKMPLKSP